MKSKYSTYGQQVQTYIDVSGIDLKSRKREQIYRRYYLINFLKEKTDLSLNAIGDIFKKDHSSIVHSIRAAKELEIYEDYMLYTVEEAEQFPMDAPHDDKDARFVTYSKVPESLASLQNKFLQNYGKHLHTSEV